MQAGKLDRRVTLRRATVTKDEFNEDVATWETVATVWASKEDVRDSERVRAQQVGAAMTTRFQIRHSAAADTVSPEDQLVCEGKTYGIVAVKELGRRVGLEITATTQADVP
jgi:SPP1 family predicted phage head-tail adaptor